MSNSAMSAEVAGDVTEEENVLWLVGTWSAGVYDMVQMFWVFQDLHQERQEAWNSSMIELQSRTPVVRIYGLVRMVVPTP